MEFACQALTWITGFNQVNLLFSTKGSLFCSSWGFSQSHSGISKLHSAYSRGLMNNLDLLSFLTNYHSPEGLSTLMIKESQWFRFCELVECATLVVTESPTDMQFQLGLYWTQAMKQNLKHWLINIDEINRIQTSSNPGYTIPNSIKA